MSDKEAKILGLLRSELQADAASDQADEEAAVEEFMSTPPDDSPDTLKRMRAKFVDMVLGELMPKPVMQVGDETYVEAIVTTRKKARLTQSFIATALGKDISFVQWLETNDRPWEIDPPDAATIAILFRQHMNAIIVLTRNSFKAMKRGQQFFDVQPRRGGTSSADSRPLGGLIGFRTDSSDEETGEDIIVWIKAVRLELQRRKALHLLDY